MVQAENRRLSQTEITVLVDHSSAWTVSSEQEAGGGAHPLCQHVGTCQTSRISAAALIRGLKAAAARVHSLSLNVGQLIYGVCVGVHTF